MENLDYEIEKCFYCGDYANSTDHFVPVSYYYNGKRHGKHLTATYGKENLIPSCMECNQLASNKIFETKDKKRTFIQERLTQRYKKVINMPFWDDEEIKEMGYKLKKEIIIQQLARKWILNRINWPVEVYSTVKLNKEIKIFLDKVL
jgi:hypothetical protein